VSAQAVTVELFYAGAWHDVTADVFVAEQIQLTRGQSDEVSAPRPARVQLTFNNATDKYRPSNPVSPLYGLAGRNTPLRVSVGGNVRAVVEASSWAPDRSISFVPGGGQGRAWVDVDGGGMLQRINQWTSLLKSPFRQYNDTLPLVIGYWPMEQARGSTSLVSTTPGTQQTFFQGVAPDSQYRPPSSAPLLDISTSADAEVGAYFMRNTGVPPTAGYQISWVARYAPLVPGDQDIFDWQTTDGSAYGLYLNPTTGRIRIFAVDNTGNQFIPGTSTSYGGYDWSQWTMFSVDAQYSAGTTSVWVNWVNAANTQSGFMNATFTGVPSQPLWWDMSTFAGVPGGSTVGHVIGVSQASTGGTVNLFNAARRNAWSGYLGETAADRISRLCALKNIPVTIVGTAAESWPMGAQPTDTFGNILAECVRTEDGLLFDDRDSLGVVFRTRGSRYNQTALALTYPGDIYPTFNEVLDDLGVHNLITVNQRDGGDFTLELTSGAVSTQDPPAGVGTAEQRVDVNTANEVVDLPTLAGWWLNHGTVDLPRFTAVTVNLTGRDPTFTAAVAAVDVGDRITITGYVEYVIDLIVIGSVETVGSHSRTITFTCAPGQPYLVGVLDSDRADSASTVLKTGVNATATSLIFRTTDPGDVWSTVIPYDVKIAGQRSTVTSMGAASLVSGAYEQVATVVRGVDGITKALAANEPITVADPARCAL
jgi:hypothetical protein